VKNIVTGPPIAAAPLAMTKDARTLSNSSEKQTIVAPFLAPAAVLATSCPSSRPFFCNVAWITPLVVVRSFKRKLFASAKALTSDLKPGSVAVIFKRALAGATVICSFSFNKGPGQLKPLQSTEMTVDASVFFSSEGEEGEESLPFDGTIGLGLEFSVIPPMSVEDLYPALANILEEK